MAQYSTTCTVVNGKLRLFDRVAFDRGLAVFCDGEEIELHMESVGEKRTRAQEKFFHGPVCKAFEPLGYRKQDAKDMLALRFIPQELHLLDGTIVRVPGHTSALSKKDYTDFLEQCMQLAAEEGLFIEGSDEWRERQRVQQRGAA